MSTSAKIETAGVIADPVKGKTGVRSDSPTQPKDEAASPEGAVGLEAIKKEPSDEGDLATTQSRVLGVIKMEPQDAPEPVFDVKITAEMVKEEEKLHQITLEEEQLNKQKHQEEIKGISDDIKLQRKQRLQFLLNKSNMYASYLVKRMKQQKEELALKEERRKIKAARKLEKERDKKTLTVPDHQATDRSEARSSRRSPRVPNINENLKSGHAIQKKSSKRKAESLDDYKISDYLEDAMETNKRKKLDDGVTSDISHEQSQPHTLTEKSAEKERIFKGEKVHPVQPELFTGGVLRPYQIEGFQWLRSLYENGVNGILADEMGLGKTIQCIALVAHLVKLGIVGPFLVCAPLSTVPNWVSEFSRFTPEVPVLLYHGPKEERAKIRRKMFKTQKAGGKYDCMPVVITSYEIAMADRLAIQAYEWKLIIVDEGHRIKNFRCKLVTELKLYRSTHRLLLTGTPLQNNLAELWSLLNFLLPEIFDDLGNFEMWFDIDYLENERGATKEIADDEQKNNVLSTLHKILSPFMLRRMKTDVDLLIPPKREVLVYAPLTSKQQHLYRSIVDRSIRYMVEEKPLQEPERDEKGRLKRRSKIDVDYQLMCQDGTEDAKVVNKKIEEDAIDAWVVAVEKHHEDLKNATAKKTGPKTAVVKVQLRSAMTMLRKACNHPYLIEYPLTAEEQFRIDDELITCSGKLLLLDKMLTELKKDGHKVLIFSQMTQILDILQDYCYHRKHSFCRLDGSYSLEERRQQIEAFNSDEEVFIFLLSTRAGGLGINLTAADTVVIYDSDWNPQSDLQAQDRCHRIGQTRPVMVYRIITANTIDQRIVERAAAKRKLEKMVIYKERFMKGCLDEKSFTDELQPINPLELIKMLEKSDYDDVVDTNVISDTDLKCLLDRSDLHRMWNRVKEPHPSPDGETEVVEPVSADIQGVFQIVDTECSALKK